MDQYSHDKMTFLKGECPGPLATLNSVFLMLN